MKMQPRKTVNRTMRTYTFTHAGSTIVIEAESLTAALSEYRRQLKAAK